MKINIIYKVVLLLLYSTSILSQESNTDGFLRDHLMVYYVENPSSDQYRLLNPDEITSTGNLFGGNPQMETAQQVIRAIFSPGENREYQQTVIEILRNYHRPVALFLYYDQGPFDEAIASQNWTNCIESGHFDACVTVEANDEYAGIVHYGSNEMSEEGLLTAKSHLLQLFNQVGAGIDLTRPFADISTEVIRRARSTAHIPDRGFRVSRRGVMQRFDISIRRMQQIREQLQNPEIIQHITNTLSVFENESSGARQTRQQIDLALILAIATRESGVQLPLARGHRRIVSAGRDAHTRGESGLDWLYDYRNSFPASIRSRVIQVEGNPDIPGRFIRNTHPAYIQERDVLAAFFVEIRAREERFRRRFGIVFSDSNGFSDEQRSQLMSSLSNEAKRAWIQAAFGSKLDDILREVKRLISGSLREGTSFSEVVTNNDINLNAIVTNDNIMPTNLSRQRTRLSLAESIIVESFLPENL